MIQKWLLFRVQIPTRTFSYWLEFSWQLAHLVNVPRTCIRSYHYDTVLICVLLHAALHYEVVLRGAQPPEYVQHWTFLRISAFRNVCREIHPAFRRLAQMRKRLLIATETATRRLLLDLRHT
jgi:hypothetical protein